LRSSYRMDCACAPHAVITPSPRTSKRWQAQWGDGRGRGRHPTTSTSRCRAARGRGAGTAWACTHGQAGSHSERARRRFAAARACGGARAGRGARAVQHAPARAQHRAGILRRPPRRPPSTPPERAPPPYVLLEPLSSVENLRGTLAARPRPEPIIAAQRRGRAAGEGWPLGACHTGPCAAAAQHRPRAHAAPGPQPPRSLPPVARVRARSGRATRVARRRARMPSPDQLPAPTQGLPSPGVARHPCLVCHAPRSLFQNSSLLFVCVGSWSET